VSDCLFIEMMSYLLKIQKKIEGFLKDSSQKKLQFEAMDKVKRAVV